MESKLASMIRTEADARLEDLDQVHRRWRFCYSFIYMLQWQTFHPVTGEAFDIRRLTDSWGYTTPDAFEAYRYLISRMVSESPRIGFVPGDETERQSRSAKAAEAILEYLDSANELPLKAVESESWLAGVGSTILEVYLHEKAKTLNTTGPDGEPISEKADLADVRVMDVYDFLPSPGAKGLDTCRDVIRRDTMHVDEIFAQYTVHVKPETMKPDTRPNVFSGGGSGASGMFRAVEGRATVYTYYARGTLANPRGAVIITAADKVLRHGPGLLEDGRLPFVMWRYMIDPGRFWGVPYIWPQIPSMIAQNVLYTSIYRSAQRKTSELWAIDQNTTMGPEFFNRVRPKTVHYMGDRPPTNLAPQIEFIGNELAPFLDRLKLHRDNAAALHDVSRALHQEGADTLGQTQIAEEKDIISLETAVRERREAYRRLAKMRLEVQKEHGSDLVAFAIVGKNRPFDFKQWNTTDYNDELEVFVYPDSGVPKTAAAKLQLFERAIEKGVLPPEAMATPGARVALARMYGGEHTDQVFSDFTEQERYAQTENVSLGQGIEVAVSVGEIHEAHLPIHKKQFYDKDWRAQETTTSFAVFTHFDHITTHEFRREEKAYLQTLAQQPPEVRAAIAAAPFTALESRQYEEELELYESAYLRETLEEAGADPESAAFQVSQMMQERREEEAAQDAAAQPQEEEEQEPEGIQGAIPIGEEAAQIA